MRGFLNLVISSETECSREIFIKSVDGVINIFFIIVSAIFVLFLPGFCLSFVFFKPGKIDLLERIALSFALSISVVPLVAFYLNLVGVKISAISVILEVVGICIVSTAIYLLLLKYKK